MPDTSQDPNVAKGYLDDWTDELQAVKVALGLGAAPTLAVGSTIVSDIGAISQITLTATGILFKFNSAGLTRGQVVKLTSTVVLSNGDTDARHHTIQITYT